MRIGQCLLAVAMISSPLLFSMAPQESKTISVLYYPGLFTGHVQLEVDGIAFALIANNNDQEMPRIRLLKKIIKNSEENHGYPFFRYVIGVSHDQYKSCQHLLAGYLVGQQEDPWCDHCSLNVGLALYERAHYINPGSGLPIFMATYFAADHAFGSHRVRNIEFYKGFCGKVGASALAASEFIIPLGLTMITALLVIIKVY